MSMPTARDLLAQADRLMRQRSPEELPVLTDLVIEEIEIPSLSERMDEVIPTHVRPAPVLASTAKAPVAVAAAANSNASGNASATVAAAVVAPPRTPPLAELFAGRPRPFQDAHAAMATSDGPNTQTAMANVREKFNEQLLAKMEELQHSVFSQVMQKLEVHAAGSLKTHLRQALEPVLIGIARDLAEQVAEDTAKRVRNVVSDAVDAEIARLREQFAKKRF